MDVMSAHWQISVADNDMDKTALVTKRGEYVFRRLSFGTLCAPWVFQHTTAMALGHSGPDHGILCYMDDLICVSSTFDEHLKSLQGTFAALQAVRLTLKPSRIHFGPKQVSNLGHAIHPEGISVG